jgi:ribosomal protein L12E/L44/L45/RPP1/RPP2
MADEPTTAPAPVQDQPTAAPEGTSGNEQPQGPFNLNDIPEDIRSHVEPYAKQLQGDYTRKTQELADQRRQYEQVQQHLQALYQDPEAQQQFLQQLGYEVEGEDGIDQEPDQEFRDPRFDQFLEQQHAQQEAEQFASNVQSAVKQAAPDATEEAAALMETYTSALAMTNGQFDANQAKQLVDSLKKQAVEEYLASKRAPMAPGTGPAASQQYDRKDPEARARRMAEIAAAHAAQQP